MFTIFLAIIAFLIAAGYIAIYGKKYTREERIRFLSLSVLSGFVMVVISGPDSSNLQKGIYSLLGVGFYWTVHITLKWILPPQNQKKEESKKSPELIKLEHNYKLTKLALLFGWMPFFLIGYFSIALLVGVAAIDSVGTSISNIFESSFVKLFQGYSASKYADDVGDVISTIVTLLMIGLIVFYAFAFHRAVKIKSEISATKIQFNVETDKINENKEL